MTPENNVCYYGLRIGCFSTTNPDCRFFAERLTDTVNQVLHSMEASDAETSNTTNEALIDDVSERFSV
jgi:hypothetical protein